ncbi:MAG: MFS transporter [Chloroflexota bacterium]
MQPCPGPSRQAVPPYFRKRGRPINPNIAQPPINGNLAPSGRGPLRAFASLQFRLFWGASVASIVSFFMTMIARGWLVLDMTDSAFLVTAVNAVGMAPMLVFSLHGGVIADRMNRRLVMIASDVFSLMIILAQAVLILTDVVQVWHVFALTILHGIVFALGMPARAATVSNLVAHRDIASGVALYTTVFSSGQLVGPAMAGYLINAYGLGVPFIASCVMLVPALVLLLNLKIPATRPRAQGAPRGSILENITEGLGYVRRNSILIGLMLMGLATTVFAMPYQTLLPVFARDILDVGPSGLGWLGAMGGAGAIVGSITVASLSNPKQMRVLMLTGGIGLGAFIVLFAISTVYLLSLILALLVGFLFQIFMTSNFTLVLVISPDYIRGRVLSIRMIALGLGPAGMVLLGAGAQVFGPAQATAAMAAITVALVVGILIAIPSLRRVETAVEEQAPATVEEQKPSPTPSV